MSNERRRQRQRERQRQRRTNVSMGYEPPGSVQMPGVFGWVQRQGRAFYLIAIVVLLLSLSGAFLFSSVGGTNPDDEDRPTPTPSASATASATGSPSATPSGTSEAIQRRYQAPPPMTINPARAYEALVRTEKGDIRVQLLPEAAPGHVNNFVFLARNRFFDGLTFHRVVPGFVAQGGDPQGTGTGGPGYFLQPDKNSLPFEAGVLAMAKSSQGISGSQFFITLEPTPNLANEFTVFGRVTEGLEVARALTAREADPANPSRRLPPADRILKVEIIEKDR